MFEGAEEAGLDGFPAGLVHSKCHQALPPGLGSALENARQLLDLSSVIPGGDNSCNFDFLDELASGGGILGFVAMEQGLVSGPLKMVVGCQVILEIGVIGLLWLRLNVLRLNIHLVRFLLSQFFCSLYS
jgi:hypothetical protein